MILNLMKMAESFPKRVENTMGKGEIARYEQFLLFPQCFQKTCIIDTRKPGLVLERVNKMSQSTSSEYADVLNNFIRG